MAADLDVLLTDLGGVAARRDRVARLGRARADDLVRRGELLAVFPRAYARPWDADLARVRLRAALSSVGGGAALSHLTALGLRDLPVPADAPLHVTAFNPRHPRGVPGELVVHRTLLPLDAAEFAGLPVVRVDRALVTSWPLMPDPERRARHRGRAAPAAHAAAHHRRRGAFVVGSGVRALRELVSLIAAGCESELELWGYTGVFDVPGLDDARRQHVVRVGERTFRLDMAYEAERLAVELDGRAYHSGPAQRERDMARDLALATLGWQTIRLSHDRLRFDVAGCRRDVLAVRAARRRQLA